jgi:uncharacterized protein YodC (DUF2158 family)
MADKPFKAGDVIVLRSGGPIMTVTDCEQDETGVMKVWCVWFDGNKQLNGVFPAAAVQTYKPEDLVL